MASMTDSASSYVRDNTSRNNKTASVAEKASTTASACAAEAAANHASEYHQSHGGPQSPRDDWSHINEVVDARPILPIAAFYMGDLRDGLPMVSSGLN